MIKKIQKGTRKLTTQDILVELAVSISQVLIFFFLSLFSSNFLRHKEALTKFVDQRINNTTFTEFWFTILSIIVVSGLFSFLLHAAKDNKSIGHVATQVLLEMPRTISIFGSSVLAMLLAAAIHLHYFPEPNENPSFIKFASIGLLFWLISFVYAFSIKWILSPSEVSQPS